MLKAIIKKENINGNDGYIVGWQYDKDGFSTILTWFTSPTTSDVFKEDWNHLLECLHAGIAIDCRLNTADLFVPPLQLSYAGGGGDITISSSRMSLELKNPIIRREFIACCQKIAAVHAARPIPPE